MAVWPDWRSAVTFSECGPGVNLLLRVFEADLVHHLGDRGDCAILARNDRSQPLHLSQT